MHGAQQTAATAEASRTRRQRLPVNSFFCWCARVNFENCATTSRPNVAWLWQPFQQCTVSQRLYLGRGTWRHPGAFEVVIHDVHQQPVCDEKVDRRVR